MSKGHGPAGHHYLFGTQRQDHAGMDDDLRSDVQHWLMAVQNAVVLATIAFGMGIDKPDVRWIVHTAMPSSLEIYHQGIGRDGEPAECLILWSHDDYETWGELFLATNGPISSSAMSHKLYLLEHIENYCAVGDCRHAFIRDYFAGRELSGSESYNACDVCKGA